MVEPSSYLAFVSSRAGSEGRSGVTSYRVGAESGELTRLSHAPTEDNASFLCLHPDGRHLYATTRNGAGSVVAFSIDRETGELTRLNSEPSGGDGPPYCSVDATGSVVLTADYPSGLSSVLPIEEDGRVGEVSHVVEHAGSGADPERQEAPHAHAILPGPDNRFAYVPDLGTDQILVYEMDLEAGKLGSTDVGSVQLHDGAGPRHLAFHPNGRFAYVINELDSTVTAFERDGATGALEAITTVETLPDEFDGENQTADVHVHPSGRWLYGSNRGHDSIAIWEIGDDGDLRRIGIESTRGDWPRNFAIDPAGRFLYAENLDDEEIVAFRIDSETGTLSPTGHVTEATEPMCMKFLPPE